MEEIYKRMKAHLLEGMVFHDEMSRYYSFLGLKDYAKCHEMHYAKETEGYKRLSRFYLRHYNKLIPNIPMSRPDIIPDSWYNANQMEVDNGTRQSYLAKGYKKWIEWETGTLNFFTELKENADPITCHLISEYIEDVSEELAEAKEQYIMHEMIGYDLQTIYSRG